MMLRAERQVPRERRQYTPADQAKALAVVLREEFGVAFHFHDATDGSPVAHGEEQACPVLAPARVAEVAAGGRAEVAPLAGGSYRLALPVSHAGRPVLVAVGELPAVAAAGGEKQERVRLQKWAQAVAERLRLTDHLFTRPGEGHDAG